MILYCPQCLFSFREPLNDGIIFCDKCERMIDSSRKNTLLSAFRFYLKNSGMNTQKIKYFLHLDDDDFKIINHAIDECYNFEDFNKYLNHLELESS